MTGNSTRARDGSVGVTGDHLQQVLEPFDGVLDPRRRLFGAVGGRLGAHRRGLGPIGGVVSRADGGREERSP